MTEIAGFRTFGELMPQIQTLDNFELKDLDIEGINEEEYKNFKAIHNMSTGKLIKIVKPRSHIFQHSEVMETCLNNLNDLGLKGVAKITNDRDKVAMEVLLNTQSMNGETMRFGLMVKSNYKNAGGVSIEMFAYREICQNGMILGKMAKSNMRISKPEQLDGAIRESINRIVARNQNFEQFMSRALSDSLEWHFAEQVMNELVRTKKHKLKLLELMNNEVENGKITRWQLYNVLTNYATFGGLFTTNIVNYLQNAAQKLLVTPENVYKKVKGEE